MQTFRPKALDSKGPYGLGLRMTLFKSAQFLLIIMEALHSTIRCRGPFG